MFEWGQMGSGGWAREAGKGKGCKSQHAVINPKHGGFKSASSIHQRTLVEPSAYFLAQVIPGIRGDWGCGVGQGSVSPKPPPKSIIPAGVGAY